MYINLIGIWNVMENNASKKILNLDLNTQAQIYVVVRQDNYNS